MDEQSFDSYNGAHSPRKTIIGNWYEERKLEELTGINRFPTTSVPLKEGMSTIYAQRAKLPVVPTHPRVMMTERGMGADKWRSTNHAHFLTEEEAAKDPEKIYYPRDKVGPRAAMLREEMMRKARDVPPPPPPETSFDTTSRVEHCPKEITGPIGRRTMKTRDGKPINLEDRDLTFLAETGISPATETGRWGAGAAPAESGACAEPDEALAAADPVTIYSEAARKGTLTGTQFFGTDHNDAAGPMGHTRDFTKQTWDMTKNGLRFDEDWGNDWPPQLPGRIRRLYRHTTLPAGGAVLPGPNGTIKGQTGPGGWAEYGGRNVGPRP